MQNQSGIATASLFATGDVRGNENLELTTLETLFVRNHNLLAGKLRKQHPAWADERLYQEARRINIAGYQKIIYNQYLPALLGRAAVPRYTGYDSDVNAGIFNEFSTVAFRMGHSMVSPTIARDGNNGLPVAAEVPLSVDFFDPNLLNPSKATDPLTGLTSTDIGPVLKAEADGNGQAMDNMAIDEIRNLLFGNGGNGGDDLIARDVQRGRDNGIGSYNALRVSVGLAPATSFAQITSDPAVQKALEAAYPGGVNTVDAFEGGVVEDHVPGSDVGPLFQAILVRQFTNLRDGDRYFYGNEHFTRGERRLLAGSNTLTKVIEANSDVTNLQPDAFLFYVGITGVVRSGPDAGPAPGQAVRLVDARTDAVIATTTTDSAGAYSFAPPDGLTLGSFRVSTTLPHGSTQKVYTSQVLTFTRGDTLRTHVNLGTHPHHQPAPPPPPHFPPPPPGPNPTNFTGSFSSGPSVDEQLLTTDKDNGVLSPDGGSV